MPCMQIARLFVMAAICCGGGKLASVFCEARLGAKVVDPVLALSVDKGVELEAKIKDAYANHSPSVVRLWSQNEDGTAFDANGYPLVSAYSGVIIDRAGLVLTCSHHGHAPETKLTIELADGKRVAGEVLGRFQLGDPRPLHVSPDLGLARITDPGEWPAATIDCSEPMDNGQVCLAIGYPGVLRAGRPPLLRIGRTLPRFPGIPWLETTTTIAGGDSGGPLFDLKGRVVGIASGGSGVGPTRYQSVSVLERFRERLESGEVVSAPRKIIRTSRGCPAHPAAFTALPDLESQVQQVRRSVIQIMDGPHAVASGLMIDANGWAITKASLVGRREEWSCRLFYVRDKAIVKGRVVATSADYDLALMKLDVRDWFVAPWSESRPVVGTIVASPLGVGSLQFSVVGVEECDEPARRIPPQIPLSVEPNEAGLPIIKESGWETAEFDGYRELLQPGDVVTHLNGTQTPTAAEFGRVLTRLVHATRVDTDEVIPTLPAPGSFHGDWVRVGIRRDGEDLTIRIPKVHSANEGGLTWHSNPRSLRRESFPTVIAHDGRLRPEQCGGPLVDLAGGVIGLNIARADATRTLAIPPDVLQQVVSELREQAAGTE